jgi:hypothetical protein
VIARIAFLVLGLILVGWLVWLTARFQFLLDRVEEMVDRGHTWPAADPEPGSPEHTVAAVETATEPYWQRDIEPAPVHVETTPAPKDWDAISAEIEERHAAAMARIAGEES